MDAADVAIESPAARPSNRSKTTRRFSGWLMIDPPASLDIPKGGLTSLLRHAAYGNSRSGTNFLCALVEHVASYSPDSLEPALASFFEADLDREIASVALVRLRSCVVRAVRDGQGEVAQNLAALMLAFEEGEAAARWLRPLSALLKERKQRIQPSMLTGIEYVLSRSDIDTAMLRAVAAFVTVTLDMENDVVLSDTELRVCLAMARFKPEQGDAATIFSSILRRLRANLLDRAAKAGDDGDLGTAERLLNLLRKCFPTDETIGKRLGTSMFRRAEALFAPPTMDAFVAATDELLECGLWATPHFQRLFRRLIQLRDVDRAERWLRHALLRWSAGRNIDAALILGEFAVFAALLRETGQFDRFDAVADCLRTHLGDGPELRYQESLVRLSTGDFERGWQLMRSRLDVTPAPASVGSIPAWDGETHVPSLLLWWTAGAGIGGEVMRLVFLEKVLERADRVGLICDARLHPALARTFPGLALLPHSALDSSIAGYSHSLDLISLPAIFGGRVSAPIKLLSPDPARLAALPLPCAPGRRLRCGLSWFTTNPRSRGRRSLPGALADRLVAAFPQVDFYSLQHGLAQAEGNRVSEHSRLIVAVQPETDTEGLLALIASMDIVITIDNSVAHFCGAMNMPTLVLLPAIAEPQWANTGSTSPLYPSLHLVRQEKPGRWQDCLAEVEDVLSGLIGVNELCVSGRARSGNE